MRVLWATTFSPDLWTTSGHRLVETFRDTKTPGTLVCYAEGMDVKETENVLCRRLDEDPSLVRFLNKNKDIIPVALGGTVKPPECRCKGGPFDVHSKHHRLPCVGYWFCKNAFRWFRKVLAAHRAAIEFGGDFDVLMWVDSDAAFLQSIPPEVVASWFKPGRGCIYLKNKRTAIETGVVGYHLSDGGRMVLDKLIRRYTGGEFRGDSRWDDCVQLGAAIKAVRGKVLCADLATAVGERNTVIQFSPLGPYLGHDKGLHRRTGVLE